MAVVALPLPQRGWRVDLWRASFLHLDSLPFQFDSRDCTTFLEVKEKKSAVKTTLEVTPPTGATSQFFKVTFGE